MESARRKHRDLLQNIVIVLLSLSAVFLFTRSQLYTLRSSEKLDQLVSGTGDTAATLELTDLSIPVRVAVTGTYGRYGDVQLTTDSETFSTSLGILLGEALGSANTFSACTSHAFFAALTSPSVYYDFLVPLPLPILAGLAGTDRTDDSISARQLLISADTEGTVSLLVWDGESQYLRCSISVTLDRLTELVNSCELRDVYFALDDQDPHAGQVASYSLFPGELPSLPVLSAAMSLSNSDSLLTALGFNPHNTKSRYLESNGTEIIQDGDRSLRIRPNGVILYQGGSDGYPDISAAGAVPTLREAAVGAFSLLEQLLDGSAGEARLYLLSIQQTGSVTSLTFGYHINGVPVRFSDGGCAAELTLSGISVTELSLRFRQYTAGEEDTLLLPLRQALAIAEVYAGAELSIGYADSGSDTVEACWLSD